MKTADNKRITIDLDKQYTENRWHNHTIYRFAPTWNTPWKFMGQWNRDYLTRWRKDQNNA